MLRKSVVILLITLCLLLTACTAKPLDETGTASLPTLPVSEPLAVSNPPTENTSESDVVNLPENTIEESFATEVTVAVPETQHVIEVEPTPEFETVESVVIEVDGSVTIDG